MTKTVKLEDVEPGSLFRYNDTIGCKTEYRDNDGTVKAYIIGSGETFCGGRYTDINELDVIPIDVEEVGKGLGMLKEILASSSRDWSESSELALIWGIVFGWGKKAMIEMQDKHGWSNKDAKKLKKAGKNVSRLAK